ncbi:hypothetical protein AMTRI_Chr08g166160 [Amborella trichopoda]
MVSAWDGQLLVTGGTKGIGDAIVEELAGLGASIYTCARTEVDLKKCLNEWKGKGFNVHGSVCSLSSRADRENLIEAVSAPFNGKLNILGLDSLLGIATLKVASNPFSSIGSLIKLMQFSTSSPNSFIIF